MDKKETPISSKGQVSSSSSDGLRVIAISSHVAHGAVGLTIQTPCLQMAECETIAIPTCILSTHPGIVKPYYHDLSSQDVAALLSGLKKTKVATHANGIITGYFSHPEQILPVAEFIRYLQQKRPDLIYLCDPVIGEEEVYTAPGVGEAIRDLLLPLAHIVTPNIFELGWLTRSQPVTQDAIVQAAQQISCPIVVVTGVEIDSNRIGVCCVEEGSVHWEYAALRRQPPHGIGDAFSAFLLGSLLNGNKIVPSLARTMQNVTRLIDAAGVQAILPNWVPAFLEQKFSHPGDYCSWGLQSWGAMGCCGG